MIPQLLAIALCAAPEPPLATVDGVAIPPEELRERARLSPGSRLEDLLEDLINDQLLSVEARRQGLMESVEVKRAGLAERSKRAAALFVERELNTAVKVDEATLRELYRGSADSVHPRRLVYTTKDEAQKVLERLEKGATWEAEARSSMDPDGAARGGDFGWRSRNQLPKALVEPAFSAPLGKLVGPLEVDLGWAVLKVEERTLGNDADFAARRESLTRFVQEQSRVQVRQHFVSQLRKQYAVTLDEAFLTGTGTATEASAEQAAHALATVGQRTVTYGEVLAEMGKVLGGRQGSHFSGTTVKKEFAWTLIDQLLLEEAALSRGWGTKPELEAAVERVQRYVSVRVLADKLRAAVPAPSDAEVEAYYRERPADFVRPPSRTCSHILLATREQAEGLKKRAAKEDFAALARQFSLDGETGQAGGALGNLPDPLLAQIEKDEPALAKAMRSARPGEVNGPVQSRAGWHLVRCAAVTPAAAVPLAEVRKNIAGRLLAERQNKAVDARIAELRKGARIAVDKGALEKLRAPAK